MIVKVTREQRNRCVFTPEALEIVAGGRRPPVTVKVNTHTEGVQDFWHAFSVRMIVDS